MMLLDSQWLTLQQAEDGIKATKYRSKKILYVRLQFIYRLNSHETKSVVCWLLRLHFQATKETYRIGVNTRVLLPFDAKA
ncbi:hypothetical protein OUZ56_000859 [Daphnia magna]|uniref:Uncharacterized protein n=1 Tax=Daphnia magna TaxID=35525 RepID=A0ABR0A1L8_9CRUS|nr:hypothetical protein OUZ56_000859 [Daphnia magna]